MSEPITLYRGNETVTTCAPSEAQRLIADGWQTEPENVEKRTLYVGDLDVDKLLPPVDPDPQFAPKRGRKPKQ